MCWRWDFAGNAINPKRNLCGAMTRQRLQRLWYEAEVPIRHCASLGTSSHAAYFISPARSVYPHAALPPGILQRAAPPSGKEYSRDGAEGQSW